MVEKVNFNPNFTDHIYFIYLNKKQSSKIAIQNYYKNYTNLSAEIPLINTLTTAIYNSSSIKEFSTLLEQHEEIMSPILELPTVKELLFSDFDGSIKSLGAWGGDFVMAVSMENPTAYFKNKGYKTIVTYKDMIL
jgi:hypothetical protein